MQYNPKKVKKSSGFTLTVSNFVVYPIYNTLTFSPTLNNVVSTGNTISTLAVGEKYFRTLLIQPIQLQQLIYRA